MDRGANLAQLGKRRSSLPLVMGMNTSSSVETTASLSSSRPERSPV